MIRKNKLILTAIVWFLRKRGYNFTIQKETKKELEYYTSEKIGTTNPSARLEIQGGGNVGI